MTKLTVDVNPPKNLRSALAIYKFICYKLQEQNTFWSFITDTPHFRYGGSFTFSEDMREKAITVRRAIKDFEVALEKRQKTLKGERP